MTAFAERFQHARGEHVAALHEWLLLAIAHHIVGDRPDRVEPRARKRRPKNYRLLTKPRDIARKQLRQTG